MKKLILSTLVLITLAACNNNENLEMPQDNALRITSGITTRAVGNTWGANDRIGVSMFSSTTNGAIGKVNTQYSTPDETTTAVFSVVNPDIDLYYPQSGEVDIWAYYPYEAGENLKTYSLGMAREQTDLMVAKKLSVKKTKDALALQFYHVLSKIYVTMQAGPGLSPGQIAGSNTRVTLTGTKSRAIYDFAKFEPNDPTSITPITLDDKFEEEISLKVNDMSAEGFAIPQDLESVTLTFEIYNFGKFVLPLTTKKFLSGSNHNYVVTISRTGVNLTGSEITDWSPDSDAEDNIGTAS